MFKAIIVYLMSLLILACTPSKDNSTGSQADDQSIETKTITYSVSGQEMKGFLAAPKGDGPFPVVLVVHEWWGQTDYPRSRARQLAREGYIGFAVDMYGSGKTAEHPKGAKAFSGKVMNDLAGAQKNFEKAMEVVQKLKKVDAEKIGAMGYCFGGAIVLEMARRGVGLDIVASYHGNLSPIVSSGAKGIQSKILVFNGANDPFVPETTVKAFKQKMNEADADYDFVNYAGTVHGFTNPQATQKGKKFNLPLAYNKKAAKDSWAKTMKAFSKVWQ